MWRSKKKSEPTSKKPSNISLSDKFKIKPKTVSETWILGDGPTEDIKELYTFYKQLGEPGSFGTAYEVIDKKTNKKYACKSIHKKKVKPSIYPTFKREVELMKTLPHHENVVSFIKAFEDSDTLYIVMELCNGGELFERIHERRKFSEKEASSIVRQMTKAIAHIHEHNICHADVKPDNFLFSNENDQILKLIDFGMSRREEFAEYHKDACGTPYYVAPEVLNEQYKKEADIWFAIKTFNNSFYNHNNI